MFSPRNRLCFTEKLIFYLPNVMELTTLHNDLLKEIIGKVSHRAHMILREVCKIFAQLIKAHPYMLGNLLMYAEANGFYDIFLEYIPRLERPAAHDISQAVDIPNAARYLFYCQCPQLAALVMINEYPANKTMMCWEKLGKRRYHDALSSNIDDIVDFAIKYSYYTLVIILLSRFPHRISATTVSYVKNMLHYKKITNN